MASICNFFSNRKFEREAPHFKLVECHLIIIVPVHGVHILAGCPSGRCNDGLCVPEIKSALWACPPQH